MHHCVDGGWYCDRLSNRPLQIFVRPSSPLFRFRCSIIASLLPEEVSGGITKQQGEEVVGGVRAVPEETAVVECGDEGGGDGYGAAEGGGERLEKVDLSVHS